MGRNPCCSKEGLNRGAWTALEDKILMAYIKAHGEGNWRNLPERAGLKRCGKSCRLRWLNYLRPDIKRGNISHDEEELIIKLHNLLGNRWSLIAGRLTGRTDNEIKNYWNTTLGKKAKGQSSSQSKQSSRSKSRAVKPMTSTQPSKSTQTTQVIRTKATVCTKCAWKEMGRSPCCSKEGFSRGAWTALEDKILMAYIKAHGEGNWRNLPERAGLKRCGKSSRLRWLNYLRPDIKRGNISHDEEELIIRLHNLLGNRWSLIAGRLPGRTGNEIKNYWNTTLGKKAKGQSSSPSKKSSQNKSRAIKPMTSTLPSKSTQTTQAIRAQATRSTKVLLSLQSPPPTRTPLPPPEILSSTAMNDPSQASLINHRQDGPNFYCGTEVVLACHDDSDFFNFGKWNEIQPNDIDGDTLMTSGCNRNLSGGSEYSLGLFDDLMLKDWALNHCPEDNATLDLESLAHLLDSEEWL